MSWDSKIKDIIQQGKWSKNSISLGRVQCAKLAKEDEKLILFIVSDILTKPLYTKVEKIVVANNEIIAFYDEEFATLLEVEDYNKFSDFFKKEEWDILFGGNTIDRLDKMNLLSDKEGIYVEPHESMNSYLEKYDKNATKEICEEYNL